MTRFFALLLGGLWAGTLVGLAEAGLVLATSAAPEEYGIWSFAFLSYGGLGAALSLLGLPWIWRRMPANAAALGAQVATVLLVFLVGRYYLAQRVFGEQLPLWTGVGLGIHAGLLVGAFLLAMCFALLLRQLLRGRASRLLVLAVAWVACAAVVEFGVRVRAPLAAVPARVATAEPGKPNLVLVVADTLRADALGIYGAPAESSPRIDAFAREGVVFRRAYAQSSWTRPSIATILTGLYPPEHGAVRKLDPLPEQVDTLAEFLQRRGYWTAAFVTNINVAPIFNFDQGFGEYHYLAPSFYFGASDSATRLASYKILRLLRERFWKHRIYFQHYYQDAEVVTAAVSRWLSAKPPQPFFLLVHYMDPHDPYFEIPYNGRGIARVANPRPHADQAEEMRRLYAQDVRYFDEHFGALLDQFRSHGLMDNTWFVFAADHGEEFFEHGGWWHGTTLYEEQIHVPLIWRGPALSPGFRSDLALTIDIFPTAVRALGYEPPRELPGVNLLAEAPPAERMVFAEEELEGNQLAMVRLGPEKLILANPGNPRGLEEIELYDLEKDPLERRNLARERPERVGELRAALEAFRVSLSRGAPGGPGQ